jgi:hypothetical protein
MELDRELAQSIALQLVTFTGQAGHHRKIGGGVEIIQTCSELPGARSAELSLREAAVVAETRNGRRGKGDLQGNTPMILTLRVKGVK